jgi:hypothetical protein
LRATCSSCQQLTVASIGPESSAFDLLRAFVTGSDSSVAEQLQVPFHCFFLLHILNQLFSRVIFANQRLIIRFPINASSSAFLPQSTPHHPLSFHTARGAASIVTLTFVAQPHFQNAQEVLLSPPLSCCAP